MTFAVESVIKKLSFDAIEALREKNNKLDRRIGQFEMKMARIPIAPLDYILVLPKKVYNMMIERTREKMLFSKQESLMKELQIEKEKFKKYQGLEMDDVEMAIALKGIQEKRLSDQEVVHFYTQMNHLQLRVKNSAITKLFQIQKKRETAHMRSGLADMIKKLVLKNSSPSALKQQANNDWANDGLLIRLEEKINETKSNIKFQSQSLAKIQSEVEEMLPKDASERYELERNSPELNFSPKRNIQLRK